jgi:hypothetical protein
MLTPKFVITSHRDIMRFFKQERLKEIIIYKVEKVMKDIELLILFMTVCDLME